MSARIRGSGKEGVLPSDPKWVVIEASDGDPRRWPTNTEENADVEGFVNYMKPVPKDHSMAIKWRMAIGQALAEMLHYSDLESKKWVLKDWPAGYQFYDHHKGRLNGTMRHDLYLLGSESVAKFRSPQEFIPHAYWLMTESSRDRSNCACKYCARKPQREISDAFGLSQRQADTQARFADLPRTERSKGKRMRALPVREGRVFATVRKTPNSVKLPKGPKQHVNPEREKDLRAMLGPKTLGERRWAREGELVWVKLDFPILVGKSDDVDSECITFWPGIIEEVQFKAEVITGRNSNNVTANGQSLTSEKGAHYREDSDPWTIVHKSIFKVKLLVSSRTVLLGSDHILPYQSHAPDPNLLTQVQSIVFDLESFDDNMGGMVLPVAPGQGEQAEQKLFKQFQSFDPFPASRPSQIQPEEEKHYADTAGGTFAVAIQIASRLSMYWTPSDAWEYKSQIPNTEDLFSTSQDGLSIAEQVALNKRLLGEQFGNGTTISTQMRFQGLWWGSERIWMGDLVRLKLARYQLVPEGTQVIKKVSGAGKANLLESKKNDTLGYPSSSLDNHASITDVDIVMHDADILPPNGSSQLNGTKIEADGENNVEVHDLGASTRSVFLRIDGLFVAHVATEDGQGTESECRMCGMLYELADDDWEAEGEEFGPTIPAQNSATSNGDGLPQAANRPPDGGSATPIRNAPSGLTATTLSNVINGSTGQNTSALSAPSIFAAEPELLSQPVVNTAQSISTTATSMQSFAAPSTSSLFLPPTISTSTAVQNNVVETTVFNIETSTASFPSLSGPLKAAESVYPTPPPPSSMKFRPILKDDYEVVMPLTTLAGRYYPGLLSNVLLQTRVQDALQDPESRESKAIVALEGLVPGVYNSVDATHFLPRRGQMMRAAENVAWRELVDYWKRRLPRKKNAIVIDDD